MSRGGRGGGRGGGGRGGGTSFSREQLNAMGLTGNDMMPSTVNQPPPLYPILDRKPLPLTSSVETDYLLLLKQVNIDHMQLSPYYIKMPTEKISQPEQEIDKLVAQLPSIKEKYDWRLLPSELRPKVYVKKVEIQRNKNVDVVETLKKLEEKEQTGTKTSVKVEDKDELNEELEDEFDEEMDDGTDYANNYFDNGEDYEDNDDNLDDGPIF